MSEPQLQKPAQTPVPAEDSTLSMPKVDPGVAPTLAYDVDIEIVRNTSTGVSGARITLQRDGSWSASKIVAGKVLPSFMSGQLSGDKIASVTAVIEGHGSSPAFSQLIPPAPLPHLNNTKTSVSVGGVRKSVYLDINTRRYLARSDSFSLICVAQDILGVLGVSVK
jgi:hypothetical protein